MKSTMSSSSTFIAVVDDEQPICKALRRLLCAAGFDVETFSSGHAFLDFLATRRPDCLILDLHMPGLSGLEVLRRLHFSGVDLPAIVITAYDEPDTRARCLAAGATGYLRKPVDEAVLRDAIGAALSHRHIEPHGTR